MNDYKFIFVSIIILLIFNFLFINSTYSQTGCGTSPELLANNNCGPLHTYINKNVALSPEGNNKDTCNLYLLNGYSSTTAPTSNCLSYGSSCEEDPYNDPCGTWTQVEDFPYITEYWFQTQDSTTGDWSTWLEIVTLPSTTTGGTSSSTFNTIPCTLLNITNIIYSAIFIVGLMLMILGGTLYAGAHVMPGQTRGILQGYGMGMIMGGIVGVIVAMLAPYIFNLITGNTINAYTTTCQNITPIMQIILQMVL